MKVSDYNFTQPMIWLNSNAKNSYKYPNLIFRLLVNPLLWVIPSSTVFSKDQTALCSDADYLISTTQQSLFRHRFHPCYPLPNYLWIETDLNQHPLATKWCLPIYSQSLHLPQSYDLEAISGTFRLQRSNLFSKPPRPIPCPYSEGIRSHFLCDLQSRYQSPNHLWPATGSRSEFQPEEERTSFLSAPAALSGKKDRRYLSSPSYHRDSRQKPLEVALGDSRDPCKERFGLLRPYNCQASLRNSCFLRHCGQNHPTHSTILWGSVLRESFPRILGLGVRIQTLAMENDSMLYRGTSSPSREIFLANFSFQDGWLYLPCDCYQLFVTTPKPLALLQLENHQRTYHSRTSRSLYFGEIPARDWASNQADFHLVLFTYNLINWSKNLCFPPDWQQLNLQTIRNRLLLVPDQLLHPQGQPILSFLNSYPYSKTFMQICKSNEISKKLVHEKPLTDREL